MSTKKKPFESTLTLAEIVAALRHEKKADFSNNDNELDSMCEIEYSGVDSIGIHHYHVKFVPDKLRPRVFSGKYEWADISIPPDRMQ